MKQPIKQNTKQKNKLFNLSYGSWCNFRQWNIIIAVFWFNLRANIYNSAHIIQSLKPRPGLRRTIDIHLWLWAFLFHICHTCDFMFCKMQTKTQKPHTKHQVSYFSMTSKLICLWDCWDTLCPGGGGIEVILCRCCCCCWEGWDCCDAWDCCDEYPWKVNPTLLTLLLCFFCFLFYFLSHMWPDKITKQNK